MAYDDNIQALLSAASIVRDETHEGGNTAARVGQLLVDMITSFDSAYKTLSDSIPEGVDLSTLKSYLSKDEAETLFDTQSVFNRLFVEDTANDAIKALKHLYSVGDISAFGYVKTELPSSGVARFADLSDVPAPTSGKTQYWGWTGSAYAWLNAPEGGGGSNVDPSDYYTKTQVNNLLADYAKTIDLPDMTKYVLSETYDEGIKGVKAWATSEADKAAAAAQGNAIATAKEYTDSKASATLSAANANAATIIEQALEDYVTLNTEQEITAAKKFVSMYDFFGTQSDGIYFYNHDSNGVLIGHYGNNYYGDDSYLQFRNGDWKGYVQFMKGIVGNVNVKNGGIEIFDTMPYIDFHYGNSTADFTSRIIESASGVLELFSSSYNPGTLKIGNAYITYDSKNNALMVSDGSGGAVNLVAMGDVAAFGGLGSGFDTLTDLTLTNKLTVKTIACSGDAVIDGELECTGEITTAYMSIDDVTIGNSIILNDDYIYMGLSNGAYIEFATNGHTSQLSDVWVNNNNQVCITINGNEYKIATIQE